MASIKFTHKKTTFGVEIPTASCTVKLYAVPKDYAPDGYFVSIWGSGQLEQMPACAIGKETLLAHLKIEENQKVAAIYTAQGVTYA